MAFDRYSDIMYKGGYDHPIRITFQNEYYMILTGEGGNRHIILGNRGGTVDLWVDTHCAPGTMFIGTIMITDEPGARFMQCILELLRKYADEVKAVKISDSWYDFHIENFDRFFEEMYQLMYISRIPRR